MSFLTDYTGLQPGQWVYFAKKPLEDTAEILGPFKVINRDDAMFDPCRCNLMDMQGNLIDFCPRMAQFNKHMDLLAYCVSVIDPKRVADRLGDQMEKAQALATAHLKHLSQFPYFGKGFHPNFPDVRLNGREARDFFNWQTFQMLQLAKIDGACAFNTLSLDSIAYLSKIFGDHVKAYEKLSVKERVKWLSKNLGY